MADTSGQTEVVAPETPEASILDGIESRHGVEADDELEPETPASEPEKAEKPPEKDSEDAEDDDSEAKAEEKSEPDEDPEEDPEYESALRALKRDGFKRKELESMSRKELIERGSKRARVQAENDEVRSKLDELGKGQEGGKQEASTPEKPSAPVDLGGSIEPLVSALALDEGEGRAALEGFAKAITGDLQSRLTDSGEQVTKLSEGVSSLSDLVEEVLFDSARGRLGERFPDLAKPATWKKVQTKAQTLLKTGDYKPKGSLSALFQEVLEDAAGIYRLADSTAKPPVDPDKTHRERDAGQATKPGPRTRATKASDPDEPDHGLLDKLERRHQTS